MIVPLSLANLAGFTIAHALWNLSDMAEDELLCPMAFVDDGAERDLLRFEADSQEEAIEQGFQTLTERPNLKSWAFAREGLFQMESGPAEVLIVEAWAVGMDSPVTFLQQYRPFASGEFEVVGQATLFVKGEVQVGDGIEEAIGGLLSGILSHEKAAELWSSWGGW